MLCERCTCHQCEKLHSILYVVQPFNTVCMYQHIHLRTAAVRVPVLASMSFLSNYLRPHAEAPQAAQAIVICTAIYQSLRATLTWRLRKLWPSFRPSTHVNFGNCVPGVTVMVCLCVCSISFDGASNDSWLRFARPVTRILATVNKATRNKLCMRVVRLTALKARREH